MSVTSKTIPQKHFLWEVSKSDPKFESRGTAIENTPIEVIQDESFSKPVSMKLMTPLITCKDAYLSFLNFYNHENQIESTVL